MFDITEMKDKKPLETLENGTRIVSDLESGKVLYLNSERTRENFRVTFTRKDESSYKVVLDFDTEEKKSKEAKLLINGKMCLLLFKYIVNLSIKSDGKLHIIAAEELKFYE
jgi:hypothetical protein